MDEPSVDTVMFKKTLIASHNKSVNDPSPFTFMSFPSCVEDGSHLIKPDPHLGRLENIKMFACSLVPLIAFPKELVVLENTRISKLG